LKLVCTKVGSDFQKQCAAVTFTFAVFKCRHLTEQVWAGMFVCWDLNCSRPVKKKHFCKLCKESGIFVRMRKTEIRMGTTS